MSGSKKARLFDPQSFKKEHNWYWTRFSDAFGSLLEQAKEKLLPYCKDELNIPRTVAYFLINGDDAYGDTCDSSECENTMLEQFKADNPDDEVEMLRTLDDGDHESLNSCEVCGRHLNTQLTWVDTEWRELLQYKEQWNAQYFKDYAFQFYCVLDAIPSVDVKYKQWSGEQEYFRRRDIFYREFYNTCFVILKEMNDV